MTTISIRPLPIRLLLLVACLTFFGVIGWKVARSAIGDSVMTFVQRAADLSPEAQIQGADTAARFAPRDPLVLWQRGGIYLNTFNQDQSEPHLATAIEQLRLAAQASPEDYRVWLTLGRALDSNGSPAEARAAFDRAVALAPNHFDPHWAFGNHLLRVGDREASFAQMRLALANSPSALPLIFDYAWNVYQGDGRAIAAALDPPPAMKAQLAALLISRGKIDDALEFWRKAATESNFPAGDTEKIATALANVGRYGAAYEIWSKVGGTDHPTADQNSLLSNGGFERQLALNAIAPFLTWHLTPGGLMKISLDRKDPREGQQALRLSFDLDGNRAFTIATQTVPVKPSTNYQLTFAVKTEELQSLSAPLVEIFDPADSKRLRVVAQALPSGTAGWKDYQLDFKTTASTEAVTLRINRLPCNEPPCPINGRLWFDAFGLKEKSK